MLKRKAEFELWEFLLSLIGAVLVGYIIRGF